MYVRVFIGVSTYIYLCLYYVSKKNLKPVWNKSGSKFPLFLCTLNFQPCYVVGNWCRHPHFLYRDAGTAVRNDRCSFPAVRKLTLLFGVERTETRIFHAGYILTESSKMLEALKSR
jgi:hypothetical protein